MNHLTKKCRTCAKDFTPKDKTEKYCSAQCYDGGFEMYQLRARVLCKLTERHWFPTYNSREQHIDHKYSIKIGHVQKIPLWVIANKNNLELLDKSKNVCKGTACSITKEELIATADNSLQETASKVEKMSWKELTVLQKQLIERKRERMPTI